MIETPNHSERDYLAAFGATAIYVAAPRDRSPSCIGNARDLNRIRTHMRPARLIAAFWVSHQRSAERIITDVHTIIGHGGPWLDASADYVCAWITNAAAKRDITLTPHHRALERVRSAITQISDAIANAHANGALQWFNAAYREQRAQGLTMSYPQARARLTTVMAQRAAGFDGGSVLENVFGRPGYSIADELDRLRPSQGCLDDQNAHQRSP